MSRISSTLVQLDKLRQKILIDVPIDLTPKEEMHKKRMEDSFYEFVLGAWPEIEGGRDFKIGWHIEAICVHLEALRKLEIKDLIINIPFRTGKSNLVSVLYCAWVWSTSPHMRFLYMAYAQNLCVRDSVRCRRLIESPWYQRYWGHKFFLLPDMNNKLRYDNSRKGSRIASSIRGSNTGEGADILIWDDPNNMEEVGSDVIREDVNFKFDFALSSRYILLAERRRLIIQQRGHERDLSGYCLANSNNSWVHLRLPMEFEKKNRCITIPLSSTGNKPWADPRIKEGELLWPNGVNAEDLKRFKANDFKNDQYMIAGQLQQRPSPAEGGIFKTSWLNKWEEEELPYFEHIIQSWDTALTGSEYNCQSSCTTWGVFKYKHRYHVMLLSLFSGWLEGPDLRIMAQRLANNYMDTDFDNPSRDHIYRPPTNIIIEAKANGQNIIQELMRASVAAKGFNPTKYGNKISRASIISGIFRSHLVWLPTQYPKFKTYTEESQTFLDALSIFPNGINNDIIDSMSQAFIHMRELGLVFHPDEEIREDEPWKTNNSPYW